MVSIKFGTIINKTDSKLIISRFLFLKEMPAKEEEFLHIPAHQTVTIDKKIDLQMVDENVYSAPLLVKKEADPNIIFFYRLPGAKHYLSICKYKTSIPKKPSISKQS